jgi:hypothetical protein
MRKRKRYFIPKSGDANGKQKREYSERFLNQRIPLAQQLMRSPKIKTTH